MATQAERTTIRCPHCGLNQFETEKCRRCKTAFVFVSIPDPPEPIKPIGPEPPEETFGQRVLRFRRLRLLTQKQLAMRLGSPRTYLTKVENDQTGPEIATIERIAKALDVSMEEILTPEPNPVLRDDFIQQLVPHLPRLSEEHKEAVLTCARMMADGA